MPRTCVRHRLHHRRIAGNRVCPVDLREVEVGKVRHQPRDIPPRRVRLHRSRNRVLVVLDHIHHRQLPIARRVQRLPELTLAGRSLPDRHIHHLVAVEAHILVVAIVAKRYAVLLLCRSIPMPRKVAPRLRAPNRMQALRGRRRARRHNMQLRARPVRRHLPAAARRIVSRAHCLQHLVVHRVAQRQADRTVAIVRKEPVVPPSHRHPGGHQQLLMPRALYLKENLLLLLKLNLAVIRTPRKNTSAGRTPPVARASFHPTRSCLQPPHPHHSPQLPPRLRSNQLNPHAPRLESEMWARAAPPCRPRRSPREACVRRRSIPRRSMPRVAPCQPLGSQLTPPSRFYPSSWLPVRSISSASLAINFAHTADYFFTTFTIRYVICVPGAIKNWVRHAHWNLNDVPRPHLVLHSALDP